SAVRPSDPARFRASERLKAAWWRIRPKARRQQRAQEKAFSLIQLKFETLPGALLDGFAADQFGFKTPPAERFDRRALEKFAVLGFDHLDIFNQSGCGNGKFQLHMALFFEHPRPARV